MGMGRLTLWDKDHVLGVMEEMVFLAPDCCRVCWWRGRAGWDGSWDGLQGWHEGAGEAGGQLFG